MNEKLWNVFLSLQGNDENTPVTNKEIVRPFNLTYKILNELDVFNYFNIKEYNKILIIGAGDGAEVFSFKIRGYDTIGITWHNSDKKYAEINYKINLLIEDMHNMKSIQSESFDGIYSYHVLEHSIAPLIALYEMRRVLKDKGKILCVVPLVGTDNETGLQHYSVLRNEHWKHLLNLIGFDNIEITKLNGRYVKDSILIKAIKGNRDCPGTYFDKEFIKEENQIYESI
ncbi:MAG: class I SAM-dependent methyltransferase [Candidatus Dojkabacteria bacterium]|nr:class I SAM-dependent methyltransferase [Candidatus Dojkabacteria bacterium]